jgi:Holliday junction resolvase-like predicted endonuclease
MDGFQKQLEFLIEKLKKELYIEYEYQEVDHYPTQFQSGLDLLETNIIQAPSILKPIVKQLTFQPTDLVHNEYDQYRYIPWDRTYDSIFACVQDLVNSFPLDQIMGSFGWQQFETFICQSLENYGYNALRTFRFTLNKKRHEIDIIGRDRDRVLVIDAKHWNNKTASPSALYKVADEQMTRVKHLVKEPTVAGLLLEKLKMPPRSQFKALKLYPIILVSSNLTKTSIVNGVPIVDIVRFNEFLNNFSSVLPLLTPVLMNKISNQTKLK